MLILAGDHPVTFPRRPDSKYEGDLVFAGPNGAASYFQKRGLLAGLKDRFRHHRRNSAARSAYALTEAGGDRPDCSNYGTDLSCFTKQQCLALQQQREPQFPVEWEGGGRSRPTEEALRPLSAAVTARADAATPNGGLLLLPPKSPLPSALKPARTDADESAASPSAKQPQVTKRVRFFTSDETAGDAMTVRIFHYKQTPLPDHVFVWAQREKPFAFLRRKLSSLSDEDLVSDDTAATEAGGEEEEYEETRRVSLEPSGTTGSDDSDMSTEDLKRAFAGSSPAAAKPVVAPTVARLRVLRQCSRNVTQPRQPSRSRSFAGSSSREAFVSRIVML